MPSEELTKLQESLSALEKSLMAHRTLREQLMSLRDAAFGEERVSLDERLAISVRTIEVIEGALKSFGDRLTLLKAGAG